MAVALLTANRAVDLPNEAFEGYLDVGLVISQELSDPKQVAHIVTETIHLIS